MTVTHFRDRREFVASLARVDLSRSGGFLVEKFAPFTGTRVQLTRIPVARFSVKAMSAAVEAALAEVRARAFDPDVAAVADASNPA